MSTAPARPVTGRAPRRGQPLGRAGAVCVPEHAAAARPNRGFPHRAATRRAVLDAYAAGAGAQDAARAYGVPYGTAYGWVRDAGLLRSRAEAQRLVVERHDGPLWDRRPAPERRAVREAITRGVRLVLRGASYAAAAAVVGCAASALRTRVARLPEPPERPHEATRRANARALAWGREWQRLVTAFRAGGARPTYVAAARAAGLDPLHASRDARRYMQITGACVKRNELTRPDGDAPRTDG